MKRERAVVIGGGIAGLVTARVLADHFGSVVIIDKDTSIGSDQPRIGASQGAHLHVLLKRGQSMLRKLLPDVESQLVSRNCPLVDWAQDTMWESQNGAFPRYSSSVRTYSFSRPFLESVIHEQVKKIPNIVFRNGHVESVRIRDDRADGVRQHESGEMEPADIVVIAGGQNLPVEKLTGSPLNHVTDHSPIHITYRSVIFETASLKFDGFKQYYYQLSPPNDSLGAVICPIEDGRSIATIVEYGPPRGLKVDFDGFMRLAKKVPGRRFHDILQSGSALSGVAVFHKPTMFLRRPDKMGTFPVNVFLVGDVFCSLNPVFGQGMTLSLIQAEVLGELLRTSQLRSSDFHRVSAARLRLPYLLSKAGSNVGDGFVPRYLKSYLQQCRKSKKLHRQFLGVLHLEKSYGSLLSLSALGSSMFPESRT